MGKVVIMILQGSVVT